MKRNTGIVFILATLALAACHRVPAGHVGVRVDTMGDEKGSISQVGVGYHSAMTPTVEFYNFPTFVQTEKWERPSRAALAQGAEDESISFQTSEGMTANADIGIKYTVDADKVVELFQRYRRGIEEITDTDLRTEVRNALVEAAGNVEIESVYGTGKQALIQKVRDTVAARVAPYGIVIDDVYWLGTVRLPTSVEKRLNAKVEATQQAEQRERELQTTVAEGRKRVAEAEATASLKIAEAKGAAESIRLRAEAQAKANQIIAKSLTRELVELRRIERWDGRLPQVQAGKGTGMIMNLPPPAKK